ncbi:hypothetical protein C0J52_13339 [Blattella germanica]|nr:hypothetical protein C0J52_13339 [Blattella germanica]
MILTFRIKWTHCITKDITDIDESWKHVKQQILDTAQTVLGTEPKREINEWFDEECQIKIEDRKKAYKEYLTRSTRQKYELYKNKRREADKICRKKKRTAINKYLIEMDEDLKDNRTFDGFKKVKHMREGYKPRTTLCRDASGKILSNFNKIQDRWKDYFSTLLNANEYAYEGMEQLDQLLGNGEEEDEEEEQDPDEIEVEMAISNLRNNRTPGIDGIPAELIKVKSDCITKQLHEIISKVWKSEKMPKDWEQSVICPIYKIKGDKLTCTNYRDVIMFIKLRRLQWVGHVLRMEEQSIPLKSLKGKMYGKRPVGKPRKRWLDDVRDDGRNILDSRNLERDTANREEWRQRVREAKARFGL